ncbi:MAG: DUF1501 domain-containing protein [Bdellovibrionota bacterium]
MTMNRRDFLMKSAYASGLVLASQTLPGWMGTAFAQNQSATAAAEDHFLLVLRVNGAWDVTMAMDARLPSDLQKAGADQDDFFYLYKDEEIVKAGEGLFAPPAAALVKHVDDIAIINGIMMMSQNNVHEQNRAYMVSGSTNADDGAFPFQLAMTLGDAPLGVAHQYEYEQIQTGGYPSMTRINELMTSKSVSQSQTDAIMRARVKQIAKINGRARARALVNSQVTAVDSNVKLKRMNELSVEFASKAPNGNDRLKAVSSVLAAFAAGTVRYAVYDFQADSKLDTHFDHAAKHPTGLKEAFDNVAAVIELMKSLPYTKADGQVDGTMFDHTTVVVMSEFARTPWKENGSGTGHNPLCNSALLFGKNIQGGRVHGSSRIWTRKQTAESRSRLQASLYDFNEGQPVSDAVLAAAVKGTIKVGACAVGSSDDCVDYIYPESIWKTVAQGFGLAQGTKAVESALTIPGLIKKS